MHAHLLLALVAGSAPVAALSLRKAAAVLSVAVPEDQLAAMLAGGEGPRLPAAARCPDCEGRLGPWPGYGRMVRYRGRTRRLRLHRARCRNCGRTHALVPSFLTAYRRDVVATIGGGPPRRRLRAGAPAPRRRGRRSGVDRPRLDQACPPRLCAHRGAAEAPRLRTRCPAEPLTTGRRPGRQSLGADRPGHTSGAGALGRCSRVRWPLPDRHRCQWRATARSLAVGVVRRRRSRSGAG